MLGPYVEAARKVFELRNLCAAAKALHQQAVSIVRVRLAVPWVYWAVARRAESVLGPNVEPPREIFELRNLCAVGEALHQQAVSIASAACCCLASSERAGSSC